MKPQPAILSPRLARPSSVATRLRVVMSAALVVLAGSLVVSLPVAAQDEFDPDRLEWEWQLLETYEGGTPTPVPAGIGITALLYRGTLNVEGACSTARGEFSLQEDSIQIFPPQVETRGCDPGTQAVDDAFYAGLQRVSTWRASGGCEGNDVACRPSTLTLLDAVGDPVMTLTGATLPPDPGLSRWNLGRIGDAEGNIGPIITGPEPWIEFQRGGHVVGDSGCGSFIGDYTIIGGTVSIGDIVTQAPDCPEAVRDQADTITDTLGDVTDFEVLPAGLVLRDGSGLTRLAFVPALDLANRTWTPFEIMRDGKALEDGAARLSTSAVRFAGRQADGRSVCRGFKGRTLSSGMARTVEVAPLEGTRCPKGDFPYKAVEDAFLETLARTASHALRGEELVLMNVSGDIIARLAPQADLAGPTWVVSKLDATPDARKARPRDPVDPAPTIEFSDAAIGILSGETGVRPYNASYDQPGAGQIRISEPEVSGPGCGRRAARTPPCAQERLFLSLLARANTVVVRPDELRLLEGERIILRFMPEDLLAAQQAAEAEAAAGDERTEDD